MQLPAHPLGGVQIGISDILQWRDCAQRMLFGMRRHGETGEAPESWSPSNAYGSAIHHCMQRLDEGATEQEAASEAFARWKQWLEPGDLSLLHEDMAKYVERDMLGVRTLLNEGEISVRLFVHPEVGQVWFRAKIDRLYQSLDDETLLIHIDYKSSKHAKSKDEVDGDLQLWSYNWSIDEWFRDVYPEVEDADLQQIYDQLRYGQVPTRKGFQQREHIKAWLIEAVTAMIADEDMLPTFNEWCPWCPLKMDCPVVQYELTDWALTRIAALMPREPKLKKDGTPSKVLGPPKLDPDRIGEYVELLPQVNRAKSVLEMFDTNVKGVLKEMPGDRLARYHKKKSERSRRAFTASAKRDILEAMGLDRFLYLVDISIASVERFFGDDKAAVERIVGFAEEGGHYTVIEDSK